MSWFESVLDDDRIDGDCLAALRELAEASSYEKSIIAEGSGHDVVFFEGEDDRGLALFRVSISPDWSEVNHNPQRARPGEVNNVYQFREDWDSVYVTDGLPDVIEEM